MSSVESELFFIYARNHLKSLPFVVVPVWAVFFFYIVLYGVPPIDQVIMIAMVTSLGIFGVVQQGLLYREIVDTYGDQKGFFKKSQCIPQKKLFEAAVYKTVSLLALLCVIFNFAVGVGNFFDLVLGYLVSSFLLIIFSSLSSACWRLFVLEVLIISGVSSISALSNLQFRENLYVLPLIVLISVISLWLGHRNSSTARTIINQKQQLENTAKLALVAERAKAELMATVSHEIRTPLNGIMGMIQMLRSADLPPDEKDSIEVMYVCSNTLLNTINDVLDYSKIEAGKFLIDRTSFDLSYLLDTVYKLMLGKASQKNLSLKVIVEPDVGQFIYGDQNRIQQVLTNLVSNAIKFTETGGVSISVSRKKDNKDILLIEVKDTGPGLSNEVRSKLFNDFVQASSSTAKTHGGTGLGLSISRKLTQLMGGRIGVESAKGEGSNFWFEIPYVVGVQAFESKFTQKTFIKKLEAKILIAEDNAINQTLLVKFLAKLGAGFDIANNGREAVDLFKKGKYDLILMDMEMPILSGIEATKEIRGSRKRGAKTIPIIGLTGNVLQKHIEQCLSSGMTDHIAKPIDLDILTEKIASYIPKPNVEIYASYSKNTTDNGRIRELKQLMGQAYADKFVKDAEKNLVSMLGEIEQAAEKDDVEQIRRLAHDIKGVAGTIDLDFVSRIAESLEEKAILHQIGSLAEINQIVREMKTHIQESTA